MLTVKKRQQYLKDLGYYKGEITGKMDTPTRDALVKMQTDITPKYKPSRLYNNAVDRMLVSAHRVYRNCIVNGKKYFNAKDFACNCEGKYCNGFPAYINEDMLKGLMNIRLYYGKPITITSGVRCKKYNSSLTGSVPNSEHKGGDAIDMYIKEVCDTKTGRATVVHKWINKIGGWGYCNKSWMGNAVHVQMKEVK